jgi:hypothetical protein
MRESFNQRAVMAGMVLRQRLVMQVVAVEVLVLAAAQY